ncbi:hypothetical protein FN846DRAFT_984288 [Sphaerosporella brunnea]|uniref:C3H1-type domain-containing protein n=1 Tax=Sphaerosporella brunnea TaxID=1250544 RepID=A0A5J5EWD6_9PEZI|nr:hypothetical protein FN846DRAFT_984288 [Sphaerosporella brunnea]
MARTRATPAPPVQITAAVSSSDEDEVDYSDTDLTDVSEVGRQLAATANEPTPGKSTQAPEPVAPAPAPAGDNAVFTVPMAFLTSMANTMQAITTHLGTLQGSHSAHAQPAQGIPPPPPTPKNPLVLSIRNHWPAVDPVHLQEILENRFKVENLLKLNASFVYTPDHRLENITLGSYQIPTTSRNVEIDEYGAITTLLKPLAVYSDILREFAPPGVRDELGSALLRYMHHLLDLNERCTWHSVRLYHFSFHRRRVLQGVYDYEGWRKFSDPELSHLLSSRIAGQGTKRPVDGPTSGPPAKRTSRTATPSESTSVPPQKISGACRRHNRGFCAASTKCRFQHVCWTCGEGTHTASTGSQAQ